MGALRVISDADLLEELMDRGLSIAASNTSVATTVFYRDAYTERVLQQFEHIGLTGLVTDLKSVDLFFYGSRQMHMQEACRTSKQLDHLEISDYDFAIRDTVQVKDFFMNHGFNLVGSSSSDQKGSCFEYKTAVRTHGMDHFRHIQVITKPNLEEFRTLWLSIDPVFYQKYIWKVTGQSRDDIRDVMTQLRVSFEAGKS